MLSKKRGAPMASTQPHTLQPAPPSEEDVEDDPSWSSEAFTVQSKKRRPLVPVRLSEVMQQVIVDYLRDHDFLYIKSALDYKDSNKREECMVEMAGMVELSVEQFKTWYRTMRTTLSRITRTGPSGSGVRKLTEREERTLQLFGFLEQHIVRLSPKCGRSLKMKMAASRPQSSECSSDYEGGASWFFTPPDDEPVHEWKRKSNAEPTEDENADIKLLDWLPHSSSSMQDNITTAIQALPSSATTSQAAKVSWGNWMAASVPGIHDSLWRQFEQETYTRINWYLNESDRIRACEQQQQQTPD